MRTTLDIADDVLHAAKERARREGRTAGEVISELARQSLARAVATPVEGVNELTATYGFRAFPSRGIVITNELIDRLRENDA
ncbi:MAG: antitoxin [Steroidobacteraceae bacterium]